MQAKFNAQHSAQNLRNSPQFRVAEVVEFRGFLKQGSNHVAFLPGSDDGRVIEGYAGAFGNPKLGGISQILRRVLRIELGLQKIEEVRTTDLGFTLRGLAPAADDIILGIRFGIRAADILLGEQRSGMMVGIHGLEIEAVTYEQALKPKTVNRSDRELQALGVFISSGN